MAQSLLSPGKGGEGGFHVQRLSRDEYYKAIPRTKNAQASESDQPEFVP